MFLSATAFYSARALLNLRGLAQVRAVGKQGWRSLCFHNLLRSINALKMTSELDAAGGASAKVPVDSSVCRAGITVADCDDVWLIPKVHTSSG